MNSNHQSFHVYMRTNKPIIKLLTPSKLPHVMGMKVVCICSDAKEREVIMDSKLASAVMGFIRYRQGGTLQLSEGVPIQVPTKMELPVSREKEGDVCGRCAGELFPNFAHKETGKFKCADQTSIPPRLNCILECDSPTLPPSRQEYMQCGCMNCRNWLQTHP
jgi:hypothetical protein